MEIRAKTTDSKRKRDKVEVDNEKPGHLILNGDCNHDNHDFVIIDVGKTRFKISRPQRILLTKPRTSQFREILRSENGVQKAASGVIYFTLDEVPDNFRALCWILNAPPNEIMDQADSSKVDFRRLIAVLHMTHMFCFLDHEKWAKTLVEKYCLADGEHGGLLGQYSIEDFKQIWNSGLSGSALSLRTIPPFHPRVSWTLRRNWTRDNCEHRSITSNFSK